MVTEVCCECMFSGNIELVRVLWILAFAGMTIGEYKKDDTKGMAERQGFEPWVHCCTHAFQACSLSQLGHLSALFKRTPTFYICIFCLSMNFVSTMWEIIVE